MGRTHLTGSGRLRPNLHVRVHDRDRLLKSAQAHCLDLSRYRYSEADERPSHSRVSAPSVSRPNEAFRVRERATANHPQCVGLESAAVVDAIIRVGLIGAPSPLPDVAGHVGVKLIAPRNYPMGPDVGDSWHTDGPPRELTQWFSFLLAHKVPPYGRDTLFADMEAAYQRLSPTLREFLEGLRAMNSWGVSNPDAAPVEHPVVITDPDTGCKSLYVNRLYTNSIVGMRKEESDMLLEFLFRQTNVPELQLRVSWNPGTLTIWDNEKTQHYLVRDKAYDRVMHRVMVNTGR